MAGLLLGLIGALGREQLDRTLKTPDDAERELKQAFLGLLPRSAGGHDARKGRPKRHRSRSDSKDASPPELIAHEDPTSGVAEAVRSIRTNILFVNPDRPSKTFLVTSAGPAEGKTTVACNLAVAMAQAGSRTIIVDCDMRRPRLHRVFGVTNTVGITTALISDGPITRVVRQTMVPSLDILTTGPLPPNPAEILQSDAFSKLLSSLAESYDRIVVDSPPVVPVTDAVILSTKVDGTVLVVKAFSTTRELGRRAVRALQDVGGRIFGTVLNSVDLTRHDYGYHQYYYYKREGYGPGDRSDNA
jgi:capsular exopolysaccharide synthesis family protein